MSSNVSLPFQQRQIFSAKKAFLRWQSELSFVPNDSNWVLRASHQAYFLKKQVFKQDWVTEGHFFEGCPHPLHIKHIDHLQSKSTTYLLEESQLTIDHDGKISSLERPDASGTILTPDVFVFFFSQLIESNPCGRRFALLVSNTLHDCTLKEGENWSLESPDGFEIQIVTRQKELDHLAASLPALGKITLYRERSDL